MSELGGEAGDAMPVPGMGWFSINKDTEGNEFGLWQNDESASMPTDLNAVGRHRQAASKRTAPLATPRDVPSR